MQPTTCSLLISTYNWPEALALVLKSALSQSRPPTEILLADDGSRDDTRHVIERFREASPVPILHAWHEDSGFRKAKILNKAIALGTCEYVIQVDGDCIMHPCFVEDHLRVAEQGVYLYGSRVNILPEAVAGILHEGRTHFDIFSSNIKNKTRNLHIPFLAARYRAKPGFSWKFRGCNASFWRRDLLNINGYNEEFEGWGREDSDLVLRLGNLGVKAKRLRYAGIVYHLHHKINPNGNFHRNDELQSKTIADKTVWAQRGLDQYL